MDVGFLMFEEDEDCSFTNLSVTFLHNDHFRRDLVVGFYSSPGLSFVFLYS